ncbi:MAG: sorbosone dehydrogenase [Caulobacter sp.]|nr:sorbosone dehydrogenase [Caulobacter sp.]
MASHPIQVLLCGLSLAALAACATAKPLPAAAGFGPDPTLPAPNGSGLPTVKIAPAASWPPGVTPTPAAGLAVKPFATGLTHPRWLYQLPDGDVLVAETNGPGEPVKGIKAWVMAKVMAKAGAGVPSPQRITLLRDADGDGVAETKTVFLSGLHSPFGMVLVGGTLYIADTDALVKVPYQDGQTAITATPVKVVDLPGGPIDHHWTKNVIASPDGSRLYVTVGSNSNVGENGLPAEEGRAAIWEVDPATGAHRIFASGLRNPNGMFWQPESGALWTAVNERDEIGDDLVPDYMTSVKDGGFYGWPFSYYGQHVDVRVKAQRPDLVAAALVPDYALGAHTASLGLAYNAGPALGPHYAGGAFVGQHGSWNRSVRSGYQVIFVPFAGGRPNGPPQPVLTDFLDDKGHARGRPVGVIIDRSGALLVADDVGNAVWRVSAAR